ncbi:MAG: class GN sortase [Gammaproteobacteria bacterium]|nr:class GN sortase [Gammaproteobacteria bacterium]
MAANRKVFWIAMTLASALLINGSWIHIKAQLAQWLLQDAWQQTQQDGQLHKPWKWADHWPVARLAVPHLQVDQIVLEGDSGNVLAFAPGHNAQSANPGEPGAVIISGHRDTHFSFLQYLQKGQSIQIETPGKQFRYQVTGSQIVDATQTGVDVAAAVDHLILVTCYPFNSPLAGGTLRYVVTAKPILL